MKKWISGIICFCMCMGLAACGNKLSDQFDESELDKQVREIISLVQEKDYPALFEEKFAAVLSGAITEEELQAGVDEVEKPLGEYKEIKKITYAGNKDKDTGTPYAVAVVLVNYEKGKAQFTLAFDLNLKCTGFWVK